MFDRLHLWRWGRRAMFACLLTISLPPGAQEAKQQRVLALYVTTPGAAGALAFETTYQKVSWKAARDPDHL